MKNKGKQIGLFCLCAVLLLPSVLLCGCEEKTKVAVHLTYDAEKDALLDTENGVTYLFAPTAYEPAYVGDAYADWNDTVLYEVKGYSPEELLTEEFAGIGGMLYADTFALPTLAEMEANRIFVCATGTITVQLGTIDEQSVVTAAVDALTNGEAIDLPTDGTTQYDFKFLSDTYEGLYYAVVYIERGTGKNIECFLYDRSLKKCVQVDTAVFDGYVFDTNADASEETAGIVIGEGDEQVITFAD